MNKSVAGLLWLGAALVLAEPTHSGTQTLPGQGPSRSSVAEAAENGPGAELFRPGPLRKFQVEVRGQELERLRRNDREYVRCSVRVGDEVVRDVGVHVKGAAGSRRGFDDRPALTLNFDKFVPDQRFHGLEKLHLNNSVQDGSLLCENICGELFRRAGVPAPRANVVRMELNGRDLGLYVLREGFDKEFVKQYFPDAKGNLYDGGFLRDVDAELTKLFGNKSRAQPELKALVAATKEPDPAKRWQRLQELLEVERFISYCALQVMCWDWDGYPMNRNNYKLYWDRNSGKITFFPHGMDQMFGDPNGPIFPNFNGLVARAILQTPEGKRRYRERMSELLTDVFRVEAITNRIHAYAAPIRQTLAERDLNAARGYDGQVQRLCDLVRQRAVALAKQLNVPPPNTLRFQDGVARLGGWTEQNEPGQARLEQGRGPDGVRSLSIRTDVPTVASWRTRVWLPQGRFRFEARVKTTGVVAVADELGEGAGLRISGARQTRRNKLVGDSPWQPLAYEFEVPAPADEVTLVCELRASKGQVWFDAESLRLVKLN